MLKWFRKYTEKTRSSICISRQFLYVLNSCHFQVLRFQKPNHWNIFLSDHWYFSRHIPTGCRSHKSSQYHNFRNCVFLTKRLPEDQEQSGCYFWSYKIVNNKIKNIDNILHWNWLRYEIRSTNQIGVLSSNGSTTWKNLNFQKSLQNLFR